MISGCIISLGFDATTNGSCVASSSIKGTASVTHLKMSFCLVDVQSKVSFSIGYLFVTLMVSSVHISKKNDE